MSNKDQKTLSVDPEAATPPVPPTVVVQQKQSGPPPARAAFVKDHATAAAASNPDDESDSNTLEEYEASGQSGPAFQSEDAAKRHRERLTPPDEDAPPLVGRVGGMDHPAVPRQVIAQRQEAANKMVKVKPRMTIARFRVGKDWYQVQAGKYVIVPKHVAELLEQKGVL